MIMCQSTKLTAWLSTICFCAQTGFYLYRMSRGQIILIDDNEEDLMFSLEAFKDITHSYSIITFRDSTSALKHIQETRNKIFIIICDMHMPKMTGIELLASINADHELKMHAIPFIFLSDSTNSAVIESAYAMAAQGYFLKPNKIPELTEIIKVILNYWSTARIPRDTIYA
jgi:CheY-like chemotaxis protein